MPFDPKIVPGDDARFEERELLLPDDLVLLSEQLRDDALRLSACYPPGNVASVAAPATSQITRRWWKGPLALGSLASGLVALGLLAGLSIYIGQAKVEPEGPRSTISAAVEDRQPVSGSAALVRTVPESLATPASFSGTMPPLTPAVFSSGVTGPEMEGWMDLRRETLAMDDESIEF